jgi:hypothetical protein
VLLTDVREYISYTVNSSFCVRLRTYLITNLAQPQFCNTTVKLSIV